MSEAPETGDLVARGPQRRQPQPGDIAAASRRTGRAIAAGVACEQFAIYDPVSEIPALINIAFAAARLQAAAAKAIHGNDIPAYMTADARLRELLEQFKGTETGELL
jgi:hypothetical protein